MREPSYMGGGNGPHHRSAGHTNIQLHHLPVLNIHTHNFWRWHLEEETRSLTTQKVTHTHPTGTCINKHTHTYTHPPIHTRTHACTHTHTTHTQTMTQSHLLLIGTFTDTRCTGVAPAGFPHVFTLTDSLKETQGQWNDYFVLHSTIRPHLDSHLNTMWKLVYYCKKKKNKEKKRNPSSIHNVKVSWTAALLFWIFYFLSKHQCCLTWTAIWFSCVGWRLNHTHLFNAKSSRNKFNTWICTFTWPVN